jgi:hypothetical protein
VLPNSIEVSRQSIQEVIAVKHESEIPDLPGELARYGLTTTEYALMRQLVQTGTSRAQLAVETFEYEQGWFGAQQHCEHYLSTIDRMISRGLFKWVSASDYEEAERRQRCELLIACADSVTRAGDIDFADEGYRLYREVRTRLFEEVRLCVRHDSDALLLSVFGETLDGCKSHAERQRTSNPFSWGDGNILVNAVLVSESEPSPIGRWRFNRCDIVPTGYRIVLGYRWPAS